MALWVGKSQIERIAVHYILWHEVVSKEFPNVYNTMR